MGSDTNAFGRNMLHCDECGEDYENGPGDHNQFCQGSPADNVRTLEERVEKLERLLRYAYRHGDLNEPTAEQLEADDE